MDSDVEPLIGRECSRVTFDLHAPPLVLWFLHDGPAARVEISAPFTLAVDGEMEELQPEGDRVALASALRVVGRKVTAATIRGEAGLRLEFSGGLAIDVPGDPNGEPWWFDMEQGTPF